MTTRWHVEAYDALGRGVIPTGTRLFAEGDILEEATTNAAQAVDAVTKFRPSYILVYEATSVEGSTPTLELEES